MRHIRQANHYLRAVAWILERITGEPFDEWLRTKAQKESYRTIAGDIATLTDDIIDVAGESVRRWLLELDELEAKALSGDAA